VKLQGPWGDRLRALVRGIASEGQAQTDEMIRRIVDSGGTSESALLGMARDRRLASTLRADVCWLIARLDIADGAVVLRELASDPDDSVREEAMLGLGLVAGDGDSNVPALIVAAQQDRAKPVRLAALHALGVISSSGSASALLEILANRNEDDEIRASAAESCAHVRDEQIVAALLSVLTDPSPLVRYSACYALGQQGDERAIEPLSNLAARDHAETPWGTVAASARAALDAIAERE